MRRSIPLLLLLTSSWCAHADERWKIQFNYDKPDTSLNIRDLQCPSEQRCIACGVIFDRNGHGKGAVVLTSDAGQHWSIVEVKDQPISLFFLNDSDGWMVTDKGLWSTNESGRSWKKVEGLKKGITRVNFRDSLHGYAIGVAKTVMETTDGGKVWTRLETASKAAPGYDGVIYDIIGFLGDHGVITGRVPPMQFADSPAWMEPDKARYHRERQSVTVILESMDGGKTWGSTTASMFGHITQLRLAPSKYALALFEYEEIYALPSRVYTIDLNNTKIVSIFGEKDRAGRDLLLFPDGHVILATVEPPGGTNQVPIPSKLKILRSTNQKVWLEMPVDYRAVAQRAILAGPNEQHMWVATDTGMILSLLDSAKTAK